MLILSILNDKNGSTADVVTNSPDYRQPLYGSFNPYVLILLLEFFIFILRLFVYFANEEGNAGSGLKVSLSPPVFVSIITF